MVTRYRPKNASHDMGCTQCLGKEFLVALARDHNPWSEEALPDARLAVRQTEPSLALAICPAKPITQNGLASPLDRFGSNFILVGPE